MSDPSRTRARSWRRSASHPIAHFCRSLCLCRRYPNEPKYSHLTRLHTVLAQYSKHLLGNPIANAITIDADLHAFLYGTQGTAGLLFLSNMNASLDRTVDYAGRTWTLPAWSNTLVDAGSLDVLYCSAVMDPPKPAVLPMALPPTLAQVADGYRAMPVQRAATFECISEPIGVSLAAVNDSARPLEQFSLTRDRTDYVWYAATVEVTAADVALGYLSVTLTNTNEFVYVFFNSQPVIHGFAKNIVRATSFLVPLDGVAVGRYPLQLLVVTMGLLNCCAAMETYTRGLEGEVLINGRNITAAGWTHQPGLVGEAMGYALGQPADWKPSLCLFTPLTWHRVQIASPPPNPASPLPSWQLDLVGMAKGFVWFNGHPLGRYWDIRASGTCAPCDWRGPYNHAKCPYDCDQPSLRLYHVPRSWLRPVGQLNTVILLEERGGDPATVALIERN